VSPQSALRVLCGRRPEGERFSPFACRKTRTRTHSEPKREPTINLERIFGLTHLCHIRCRNSCAHSIVRPRVGQRVHQGSHRWRCSGPLRGSPWRPGCGRWLPRRTALRQQAREGESESTMSRLSRMSGKRCRSLPRQAANLRVNCRPNWAGRRTTPRG
jgi:hypothetical protein